MTIPWLPTLGVALNLRLDALGFLFALVVLVVGALVMAYAVYYLPDGRHGSFYALLTFFAAAMLGLVMANDLVVLWVTWEFTTLTSFLLVSQSGPKGQGPAIRTLLVTGAGGLCLLAGVALTVTATGTTVLDAALRSPVWAERPDVAALVATLVAFAAFTKSAQFPFHAWLPDAMVAPTPVSAYLHAAAMVKAGIYVPLRFSTAFRELPAWTTTLLLVGLVTALMGAVFALQRHDLKELLAYSTVSQLGFLVATIGLGTEYALVVAKFAVIAASFEAGQGVVGAVALGVSLFTLLSMLKIWGGMFLGEDPLEDVEDAPRIHRGLIVPAGILAAASVALGLGAEPLLQLCLDAARDLLDPSAYAAGVMGR